MATYDLTSNIPSNIQTGDILNCPYSGTYKQVTLPKGTYKLECWGAEGGGSTYHSTTGGKGGYSSGTYIINKDTTIYLYVGGQGNIGSYNVLGGWNGGGGVTNSYNTGGSGNHLGTGGGATDISVVGGECTLDSYNRYIRTTSSYNGRILVAGGGGGAEGQNGLPGGGTTAIGDSYGTYGGTQSSAGSFSYGSSSASSWVTMYNGGLGYGVSTTGGHTNHAMGSCGGGGYYGGGAYGYNGSYAHGYGGSGFVNNSVLTDGINIAGNTSFTSPTGSTETGHSGNGYIRITVVNVENNKYLKNLLIYGNFENTGWINASRTTLSYVTSPTAFGTYSLKVAASDTTNTETYFRQNTTATPLIQNHVYYFSCYVYLPIANAATAIQAYWPEAEPNMGTMNLDQTKVGQWQRVSIVVSRTNWSSGSYQFRLDVQSMVSPNYVYLDGAMLIDLTASYGEGNEPDKTWCDNHISFFEGEISREYTGTKVYIKVNNIWKEIEL